MIRQLKNKLKGFFPAVVGFENQTSSRENNTNPLINAFIENPNNPYLVSFPRTGSHWLRMMMELYFERPSLVRAFYYPEKKDFLTLHDHDLELDIVRSNVIYLYRDPVETIYSQLRYHKENLDNRTRIDYWSDLYGRHLNKWLHTETFTQKKTVIRYDRLGLNLSDEFEKICIHFGLILDTNQLASAAAQVSRENVKEKTTHDPQVMDLSKSYETGRERFRSNYSDSIWEVILRGKEHLQKYF